VSLGVVALCGNGKAVCQEADPLTVNSRLAGIAEVIGFPVHVCPLFTAQLPNYRLNRYSTKPQLMNEL